MGVDESEFQPANDPVCVRLVRAREAMGMSVADLVAHTRVQERFLRAIEQGNYAALPGRAYAFGFARSYASHVGLDPDVIIADLRHELGVGEQPPADLAMTAFTPGDPARVPSAKFAAIAAAAAVLLAGGGYALWHSFSAPDPALPSLVTDTPTPQPQALAPTPTPTPAPSASASGSAVQPSGPVVFTALDSGLWVKFYDASGKVLMNKQMMAGETYTLPADATAPMLWTGRPEALAVSIGGRSLGKLDDTRKTVHDLPVNAGALLARLSASGSPSSAASGSPMGQANRAAMPMPSPSGTAPHPASQSASNRGGTAASTQHRKRHDAAQPSGTPSDGGSAAAKASTVSE